MAAANQPAVAAPAASSSSSSSSAAATSGAGGSKVAKVDDLFGDEDVIRNGGNQNANANNANANAADALDYLDDDILDKLGDIDFIK